MDWKIETWDVGYYQVRNAMKGKRWGQTPAKHPAKHSNANFCGLCAVILRFKIAMKTEDFTQVGERRNFKGGGFLDHRDTLFRP